VAFLARIVLLLWIFVLWKCYLKMNVEDMSNVSGDSTQDDPGKGTSAQAQTEAPVNTSAGGAQGEATGKNTPHSYQCGLCQNKHPKPTLVKCVPSVHPHRH
jgi:hypothetical protein